MEKRLGWLEALYQSGEQTASEASYSIEWTLKWPRMGLRNGEPMWDPTMRAAAIAERHGLDEIGIQRAIELALTRCGLSRRDAGLIATLDLAQVLAIAAGEEKEAMQ